jgi:hypothetical protein
MQNYAGSVEDTTEGRSLKVRESPLDACNDVWFPGNACQNLRSCRIDRAPNLGDYQRTWQVREVCSKLFDYLMDGRKFAEFVRIAHEFDGRACV